MYVMRNYVEKNLILLIGKREEKLLRLLDKYRKVE